MSSGVLYLKKLMLSTKHSIIQYLNFNQRLYGGYEALKGGKSAEAMTDFTGGVVESYDLRKNIPDLFDRIMRFSRRSSLMSCSIEVCS